MMRRLIELITFILVINTICVFSASIGKTVSVSDKIEELVHDKCPLMTNSPFVHNLKFLELCSDFNQVNNITELQSLYENFARCYLYYNSLLNLCSLKQLDNTTVHKYFNDTQIINAKNSCDIFHNVQNDHTIKLYFGKPEICNKMCIEPDGSKNQACIWSAYLIETTNVISLDTIQTAKAVSDVKTPVHATENKLDITTQKVEAKYVANSQEVESASIRVYQKEVEISKTPPPIKTTIEETKFKINATIKETVVNHSNAKIEQTDVQNVETTQQNKNKNNRYIEAEAIPKSNNKEGMPIQSKVADLPLTSTTVTMVIDPVNNKPDEQLVDKNEYNHAIPPEVENPDDGMNVLDEPDDEDDEIPPVSNNNPSHEKPVVEKSKPLELKEDMDIPTNIAEPIEDDSYFFSYFMMVCIVFIMGYVGYHNKQKILALVLEGRRGKRQHRRRPNSANYHKLDSNLEEAVTSSCNKNTTNVIY